MNTRRLLFALTLAVTTGLSQAAFHVMQVEEVIGGLFGNTNAQAIQLRLRSSGQNQVQSSSLWAADATGGNRILLLNIASAVTNSAAGSTVLLTSSAFTSAMIAGGASSFSPDFTLANTIPASFLTAGRLTFEADGGTASTPGTIYWSVSWGGASYTGSQTGNTQNDADGNFGPAFASALPTSSFQGIRFQGAASALSTSNSTNYALTANPATVTKNSGTSFTVVPEPGTVALLGFSAVAFGGLVYGRRRSAR